MTDRSKQDAGVEEVWRNYMVNGISEEEKRHRRLFKMLPAKPAVARCKYCYAPFRGLGAPVARILYNKRPSNMNPKFCQVCEDFAREHQGGAEIELSMLFADIRGSTTLAESMSPLAFSRLIDRYYSRATEVLVEADALIDKLAGDEVAAIFVPGTGAAHAMRAIEAAKGLLRTTGHADPNGPWVPVGAGVHMGIAFVGAVGSGRNVFDITALGDAVNTAARLASQAGPGEVLISEDAARHAGINTKGLEHRQLELKGKRNPVGAWVLTLSPVQTPASDIIR